MEEHLRAPELPAVSKSAPKRKYNRRVKSSALAKVNAPAPAAPPKELDDEDIFFGMSATSCGIACINAAASESGPCCWITGDNICGNPLMGALQPKFQADPKAVARHARALRYLRTRKAGG